MRIIINNIRLPWNVSESEIIHNGKKKMDLYIHDYLINSIKIHKLSVDARHKNDVTIVCSLIADIELSKKSAYDFHSNNDLIPISEFDDEIITGNILMQGRPVIIGFGPAGMFAGLFLSKNGYNPIIIEKGKNIEDRIEDVNKFIKFGSFCNDSNIQFGAGGAGAFSDGKLLTRVGSKYIQKVLKTFVDMGAPEEILWKARPHIGSNFLPNIVKNFEKEIISSGGNIIYSCSANDICNNNVVTNKGEIPFGALIIASGHSSREIYSCLIKKKYSLLPKSFSVGLRIEHLTNDIDQSLYGNSDIAQKFGHAEYNLSCKLNGRGIYSFCMCPGGFVVPSSSEENTIVTNGMSNYSRDGLNSNSAIAVSVHPDDYGNTVESALNFVRSIEKSAYSVSNSYKAPCETVGSFLKKDKINYPTLIKPTYMDGNVCMTNISNIYPNFITESLKYGIMSFSKKINCFDEDYSILSGPETRTSSPIRILRNDNFESLDNETIYPCGEGAGYSGGITSSAIDGIKVAEAIMRKYKPSSEV